MATLPRNPVGPDEPEPTSEPVPEAAPKRPEWYPALAGHPAWRALEAEAGDLLSYAEDRLSLGSGANAVLAGDVHRVSRILLGAAGWNASGDHAPPFSLLITRA